MSNPLDTSTSSRHGTPASSTLNGLTTRIRDPRRRGPESPNIAGNDGLSSTLSPPTSTTKDRSTEVSDMVKFTVATIFAREMSKLDLRKAQEQLNQDITASELAAKRIDHASYVEQLNQRRSKSELKRNAVQSRLEHSRRTADEQINKATSLISDLCQTLDPSATVTLFVGKLQAELAAEKQNRAIEIAALKSEMREYKNMFENIKSDLKADINKSSETSSQFATKNDELSKKVSASERRIQDQAEEIQKLRQQLNQSQEIAGQVASMKQDLIEQRAKMAKMDSDTTNKTTLETMSSQMESLSKKIDKLNPDGLVTETTLEAYVQNFNLFRKGFDNFRTWTETSIKALAEAEAGASSQAVLKLKHDVDAGQQRLSQMLTTIQATSVNQTTRLDAIIKDNEVIRNHVNGMVTFIKGMEHSVKSLNIRYNNLSSEALAKRMTDIIDVRRDTLHKEAERIKLDLTKITTATAEILTKQNVLEADLSKCQADLETTIEGSAQTKALSQELQALSEGLAEGMEVMKKDLAGLRSVQEKQSEDFARTRSEADNAVKDITHRLSEEVAELIGNQEKIIKTECDQLAAEVKEAQSTINSRLDNLERANDIRSERENRSTDEPRINGTQATTKEITSSGRSTSPANTSTSSKSRKEGTKTNAKPLTFPQIDSKIQPSKTPTRRTNSPGTPVDLTMEEEDDSEQGITTKGAELLTKFSARLDARPLTTTDRSTATPAAKRKRKSPDSSRASVERSAASHPPDKRRYK